jgi:predicted DNA-binding transcriptional regulator AlpA
VERTISGPPKDVLTHAEVCDYLRLQAAQLDRLIRRREFPRGVPYGEGKPLVWYWEDVWAWRHLRMRLHASPEPDPETPET